MTLQGKASARLQSLCSNLFLKGSARLQQGTLPFVQKFLSRAMQGKASTSAPLHHSSNQAHVPSFKPHLKGSARLQGFTLRGQYFFSRALQGFSKASLSRILVKGYEREGFNKRSSSSFNQSDTVPETNRYALPTS